MEGLYKLRDLLYQPVVPVDDSFYYIIYFAYKS